MSFEVNRADGGYVVKEYFKNKETGEIEPRETFVDEVTVQALQRLFVNMQPGIEYKYAYIVGIIVRAYGIAAKEGLSEEQIMTFFNGGKFRKKYYFPLYYYPLKVLEYEKRIIYYGRGGVEVISHVPLD